MSFHKTALLTALSLGLSAAYGEIIYSGANQNIFINSLNPTASISLTGASQEKDTLNIRYTSEGCTISEASTQPGHGSHVQTAGVNGYVSNLDAGTVINASINYTIRPQRFFKQTYSYEFSAAPGTGNFLNQTGYIGLKLSKGTSTYFGWAQICTENTNSENAGLTIRDWAYNTVTGQAITAGQVSIPEPNSMALITACSAGLLFFRRIFLI